MRCSVKRCTAGPGSSAFAKFPGQQCTTVVLRRARETSLAVTTQRIIHALHSRRCLSLPPLAAGRVGEHRVAMRAGVGGVALKCPPPLTPPRRCAGGGGIRNRSRGAPHPSPRAGRGERIFALSSFRIAAERRVRNPYPLRRAYGFRAPRFARPRNDDAENHSRDASASEYCSPRRREDSSLLLIASGT